MALLMRVQGAAGLRQPQVSTAAAAATAQPPRQRRQQRPRMVAGSAVGTSFHAAPHDDDRAPTDGAGSLAAAAAAAPTTVDQALLEQELREQLAQRWLPFDLTTARKALSLARALQAGRWASSSSIKRARIAANALPVYKVLLMPRVGGDAFHMRAPPRPAAPDAQILPDSVRAEVLHDRGRLATTVQLLRRERAECERALARGGLSDWRAETLASQAESLSTEIAALERLLRMSSLQFD